jgi:hypothetical protein
VHGEAGQANVDSLDHPAGQDWPFTRISPELLSEVLKKHSEHRPIEGLITAGGQAGKRQA